MLSRESHWIMDENLILGFVGGTLADLGGVWTAYRLLGHAIHRELDSQSERIGNLETKVNNDNREVNSRLDREMMRHFQSEKEAQDGRLNLGARLLVIESQVQHGSGTDD